MNSEVFGSEEHALVLAETHFGRTGSVKMLASYADKNYRIETPDGQQFVLKITLSEEETDVVAMQNEVLEHLGTKDPDLGVPRVVPSVNGHGLISIEGPDGRPVALRMLSFLPGLLWYQIESKPERFFRKLGGFLGHLNRCMADFQHRAGRRYLAWDLRHALDAMKNAGSISDPELRYQAEYLLTQFDAMVLQIWDELPQQIIHNDCNDYNLLVTRCEGFWKPTGIIDFGDMVHTARIAEPAIAAAYAVLGQDLPLNAAGSVLAGYHEKYPLTAQEIDVFFYLLCARLAVSVCTSAARKLEEPDNHYLLVTEAPAWKAIGKLLKIEPNEAAEYFRHACGIAPVGLHGCAPQVLLKRRRRSLGPSLSVSYQSPLKITRGRGQYLLDHQGRAFLDCVNNVCHVGHCHPKVVAAAVDQLAVLNTNTRYLHDHLVDYAEALTATFPEPLSVVFFVNSGSEANDLALRMARMYTGGEGVVALEAGYHGHLTSLIDFSHYKFNGPGGQGPAPWARVAALPDKFRGLYRGEGDEVASAYAAKVRDAIVSLQQSGQKLAAFFCESLPGCGGQIVLPDGYLEKAYAAVREAGGLCVADEVQVGFGRVGSHFWAFETQGVVPDIVTLGKPMGNGHPLAAVVTTEKIANAFANGMEYFNTFGGNPVSCAIGKAVLEVIHSEHLTAHAESMGKELMKGLLKLKNRYSILGDVRGMGLFLGVELVKDHHTLEPDAQAASLLVNQMRQKGILLSTDGPDHNVIKFKPPMVFNRANVQFFLDTLDLCLGHMSE